MGGQERYKSLAPMYYRGAAVAVVVYDISSEVSFEGAKNWVAELKKSHTGKKNKLVIGLLGNKMDLENRAVETARGQEYATSEELIFMETSAKTGVNVTEIFGKLANELELTKQDDSATLKLGAE